MKNSLFALSVLTGLFASVALAKTGGEASGGGNTIVPLSSAQEVSQAIDEARVNFLNAFVGRNDNVLMGTFICPSTGTEPYGKKLGHSPRLGEILGAIANDCGLEAPQGVVKISAQRLETMVSQTAIEKRASGSCKTTDGAHREAAVLKPADPNSPICFSIPRLQRVPKDLLPAQILGLMAHEFTHKFGYGEKDAVLVQKYFVSEVAGKRGLVRGQFEADISGLVHMLDGIKKIKERESRCQRMTSFYYFSAEVLQLSYMSVNMNLYNAREADKTKFVRLLMRFKPTIGNLSPSIKSYCDGKSTDQELDALIAELQDRLNGAKALIPSVVPMTYK